MQLLDGVLEHVLGLAAHVADFSQQGLGESAVAAVGQRQAHTAIPDRAVEIALHGIRLTRNLTQSRRERRGASAQVSQNFLGAAQVFRTLIRLERALERNHDMTAPLRPCVALVRLGLPGHRQKFASGETDDITGLTVARRDARANG